MRRWWLTIGCLALLAAGCSGRRDADGLGASYARYQAHLRAAQTDAALRALYDAYLEVLRMRDPGKAMRFFRPDMSPQNRNAVRLGLEFVKILASVKGRLTGVKVLPGRALLKAHEIASFHFRGQNRQDSRDRVYQLRLIDGDWYLEPPDLGRTRKKR